MRPVTRVAAMSAAALAVAPVAAAAIAVHSPSRHHLHAAGPPLPRSLSVDEHEWSVIPSERVVAAGIVHFTDYNRGQDEHDLVIKGPGGTTRPVYVEPGQSATIVARLRPGTYTLYCSMFMGTPQSHYALGMHTLITVR
jgi:plastocyanin